MRLNLPLCYEKFPDMKTVLVDEHKRVCIPDAEPQQVFAYENHGGGRFTLTLVDAEMREPVRGFAPGILKKFVTRQSDREMLALLQGCSWEAAG